MKSEYRIGKTSKQLRETNQHKIRKAIEQHENVTFGYLLDFVTISREPLSRHLKALIGKGEIEKYFNKTQNKIVYRLTEKGIIPLQTESMIQNLGSLATYMVWATKLGIDHDFLEQLNNSIQNYIETESKISPKKYMKHLKQKYPLEW